MIYRKITSATELPAVIRARYEREHPVLIPASNIVYYLTRDDGTPLGVFGIWQYSILNPVPLLWLWLTSEVRHVDARGILRGFKHLQRYLPRCCAQVDETNSAAVRLVQHLGFTRIQEGVYEWKA